MVRSNHSSVRDLSHSEQVVKYVQEDGAALSPASKDSFWSNTAVSGTSMKRSKKLQSVLIKMSRGNGEEEQEETRELHVYKNKNAGQHLNSYEAREDDGGDQQSLLSGADSTAGREQEKVRAAIRDHFFHAPAYTAPPTKKTTTNRNDKRTTDSTLKKKVVTSPSGQNIPSPRSRTRILPNQQIGAGRGRSPGSEQQKRRHSTSPRRKGKSFSVGTPQVFDVSLDGIDRPNTPKRTGRNPSPPHRVGQSPGWTHRPSQQGYQKSHGRLPDDDEDSSDNGVDFIKKRYQERKTHDHKDNITKSRGSSPKKVPVSPTKKVSSPTKTKRNVQWEYDSIEESTVKSSSSDYDSSTTGSFSVDRMRSMRRKIQKANQKKGNGDRSMSPRKKVTRPQHEDDDDDDDEDEGGFSPLLVLDIAGAATDFMSQIVTQMTGPEPFLFPSSPGTEKPSRGRRESQKLHRPSYDTGEGSTSLFGMIPWDDTNTDQSYDNKRRSSPKRISSPRRRVASVPVRNGGSNGLEEDKDNLANSVVSDNSIVMGHSSPKRRLSPRVTLVNEKEVSEVIKAAVQSPYQDVDGSMESLSSDNDSDDSSELIEKQREDKRHKSSKHFEHGESHTSSADQTSPKKVRDTEKEGRNSAHYRKTSVPDKAKKSKEIKVNSLVAKFEHDANKEKLLKDFDEEKATRQNLAVALSMSGDDSMFSDDEEDEDLHDDIDESKTNTQSKKGGERPQHRYTVGRPVFPPEYKHELESKIKESYERQLKRAEEAKAVPGVSPRKVSNPVQTRSLIPPDAPVTSKKVAVNYINALAKQLGQKAEYAKDYLNAISRKDETPTNDSQSPSTPTVQSKPKLAPTQDKDPVKGTIPLGANKTEMDDLVSKIDGVVQRLIESGKLPAANDSASDDLQKRNTAELLKNLAILRSRRSKTETAKEVQAPSNPQQWWSQNQKPELNHTNASSTAGKTAPENSTMKASGLSNLARIRAKRDEAAMKIRQQTQKLVDMKADETPPLVEARSFPLPQSFPPHQPVSHSSASSYSGMSTASVETSRSSRSHGSAPRPEDGPSPSPRSDLNRSRHRERDSFAHLSSTNNFAHLSSTRNKTTRGFSSRDDTYVTPRIMQRTDGSRPARSRSAPRSLSSSSSTTSTPYRVRKSDAPSGQMLEDHPIFRRSQMRKDDHVVERTASDDAMKEWESDELNKLQLILNPSKTDGGSRDENDSSYNNRRSKSRGHKSSTPSSYHRESRQVYDKYYRDDDDSLLDDENNDYDDYYGDEYTADDTDGSDSYNTFDSDFDSYDESDEGSESDGERLERIAMMVQELKKRRRQKVR